MDFMRTGIVISYNAVVRCGLIKDCNEQKIRFYNENLNWVFKRFDVVNFSVVYLVAGLRAVNVTAIINSRGEPVSLAISIS